MKLFILTVLSIFFMSCTTLSVGPETINPKIKDPDTVKFIVIGILHDSAESRSFYKKNKALVVYPLDPYAPIDVTLGLKWFAEHGKICELFNHHPKTGKCDFCGADSL